MDYALYPEHYNSPARLKAAEMSVICEVPGSYNGQTTRSITPNLKLLVCSQDTKFKRYIWACVTGENPYYVLVTRDNLIYGNSSEPAQTEQEKFLAQFVPATLLNQEAGQLRLSYNGKEPFLYCPKLMDSKYFPAKTPILAYSPHITNDRIVVVAIVDETTEGLPIFSCFYRENVQLLD